MSAHPSSSGNGFGSRGSGEEEYVKYRDSAAENKYIEGKTSRSGNVHVITHGSSHQHYEPAEPRSGEGKESDYKKTSTRYERHEKDKLRSSVRDGHGKGEWSYKVRRLSLGAKRRHFEGYKVEFLVAGIFLCQITWAGYD
ncbi:hypothetical protein EYC84_006084 [Monilinia fructicola]|uniref:Uncharacterized protein n=1 Tax=Monilinia fructicola TaxID=38448 RepID=A0A5M9K624_MONFR|nr:hypothetical protein EYC84_006084 [Monilinia fructicola]